MPNWDGNERRSHLDSRDHDTLIEIRNDVKHLVATVSQHTQDDLASFRKHEKDLDWVKKVMYTGFGGGSVVIFILKLLYH